MHEVYAALGHPKRREILALLRERDMTPGELAERLDLAKPTLSGHLNVLKAAGLLQGDRNGTSISYHLNVSVLEDAMSALMSMLKIGGRSE